MIKDFLDLIYPRRCPVCGGIVQPKGELACPSCREQLQFITERYCMKCGKPVEREEQEYCFDCARKTFHFKRGCAVWVYDTKLKKSIADFKYHNKKEYADFYIEELVQSFKSILINWKPDALIPVPIHRSKKVERGFNQAELLANGIGKKTGIPVITDLLIRSRKTIPQKELNDKERLKNLIQAFAVDKSKLNNYNRINKVILVDDIYTTGSTIEACSNVLFRCGIRQIYFICLCIGKGI